MFRRYSHCPATFFTSAFDRSAAQRGALLHARAVPVPGQLLRAQRLPRLELSFREPALRQERRADKMFPSLHGQPDFQPNVRGLLVQGWARHRRPRIPRSVAPDRELRYAAPIETHLHLVRLAQPLDLVGVCPLETNLEPILAVDRKVMANGDSAP